MIRKIASYILLISVHLFTWLVATLGRRSSRRRWKPTGRIAVTGTFFNPNWYLSHITPLTRSGVTEVILVIDAPQQAMAGVRFACPPRWLAKLISRAGAKALWMIVVGFRYRPDLYMGYHIVPAGCAALVAGRLFGRPSCYQMTGAPAGLVGGFPEIGRDIDMSAKTSLLLEALVFRVVRHFDHTVVRGNKSKRYLEEHNVTNPVHVITGSVTCPAFSPEVHRDIHLVFVGRLAPVKQIDQFIEIVGEVGRVIPSVKAAIVGDGPLRAQLQGQAKRLGIMGNTEFLGKRHDVQAILARSKVFVLTSKSEGLSIAMAEAMTSGVVPVVADVGELSDFVTSGINGYLVEPGNIAEYARRIVSLLQDSAMLDEYSQRAVEDAKRQCDIEVVTARWRRVFQQYVTSHSSSCARRVLA